MNRKMLPYLYLDAETTPGLSQYQINTIQFMCKEERRWGSLKRGITLHFSTILKKVNLFSKA